MLAALVLVAAAAVHQVETTNVMVCKEGETMYFVKPEGLRFFVQGANGAPNMLIFRDTEGNLHQFPGKEKAVCVEVEPGVDI